MKNGKSKKKATDYDFIGKGFKKLDSNLISERPPKIKWGKKFESWTLKEQNEYLKKLATTMNHAAYLIQEERNALLKLMDKKEKQLIKVQKAMDSNVEMVHDELEKINLERQSFNSANTGMKGNKIKDYLKNIEK